MSHPYQQSDRYGGGPTINTGGSSTNPYSPYGISGISPQYGSPQYGRDYSPTVIANEKGEQQLTEHISKALSKDETAPKQKHVRACIVYTHDLKSSGTIFLGIKAQPIVGDDVLSWKTLILFHKIISQGHSSTLNDAQHERHWLEQLAKSTQNSLRGYGLLIKAYVQYIVEKLKFHQRYPLFTGNFDYEEYLSLRGVEDPNEGYETIDDLIILLDKLDAFQKLIFNNLQGYNSNECRISALVPLVEESYGIYQFLVSMLTAMHMIIGSVEVLAPLREKFNQGHYALFQFYCQCTSQKYLASLITIPKLSQSPPDFLSNGPPTQLSRSHPKKPDFDQEKYMADLDRQRKDQEDADMSRAKELSRQMEQDRIKREQIERQRQIELQRQQQDLQRQLELQRQAEMQRQSEEERQRQLYLQQQQSQMQHMESQMLQQRFMELSRDLENSRSQAYRDKSALDEAGLKMRHLENQLAQLNLHNASHDQSLQEELNNWKQKYEALAKLYAQLRKEHLDLLTKFKEIKDAGGKISDDARREIEKVRAEMRAKNNEVSNLLMEKDRLKNELDRIKSSQDENLSRLTRELSDANDSLMDMSKSKGAEVQSLIARFNAEKADLERLNASYERDIEEMRRRLDDALGEVHRSRAANEEDGAVLQSGLDQTLLALANLQRSSAEKEEALYEQLRKLQGDQIAQLNRMMDNILQTCIVKVEDAVYELENESYEGNVNASAEYVLSLLEKTQGACGDFANSFIRLVQGGDQSDSITSSNAFAHAIAQLCVNAKGACRLADHSTAEDLIASVKDASLCARGFFERLKVRSMMAIEGSRRPEHIMNLSNNTLGALNRAGTVFEKLVSSQIKPADDIGDMVERGMLDAAKAIQEAALRLEALMNRPALDLKVHGSILAAALAITTAIANLIKCASESQKEIVAHGSESGTKGAFYKKNNKWSEGLLSAAKAVAHATTYLVEGADGLVSGTHSVEQLIVAANEVGVATTQLVAAARVKAIPFSKTQDKLEDAAVAVREATKQLVKSAKEAAQKSSESRIHDEMKSMSSHQFKVVEMEQQVRILELEKDLQNARFKLASIRKQGYAE